jgi:predicted phosphate transport protein (TIGR00153 family)
MTPSGGGSRGALAAIENLFRGGDGGFFDLFQQAAANVVRGAELLDEILWRFPESHGLARDVLVCEQNGDALTHELIRRLNQTFVTPIEREDILVLASALDDIIDLTEEVADYLGLYRVEAPMLQAQALARVLLDATRQLEMALPLARRFQDISRHMVEIHRLENEGDRIVRGAIASLFAEGTDPLVVIRWKDLFERLEDAIDATERAALVLEGIVIKNA